MRLEYRSNAGAVVREVEGVARRATDPTGVLEDIGERMVEFSIPENFRRGGRPDPWPGSEWSRSELMTESRRLANSVRYEASRRRLRVGTNLRYAAQRHFGGELEPTRARALAIPLPGVRKSMARPKRWGDRLVYLPPGDGGDADSRGVLATKRGKGKKAKYTPRFALRARVTQPARPFLVWQDDDQAYAERAIVRHLTGGDDGA